MNNKNDLYIEILKYGKENVGNILKFSDLKKHIDNKGIKYDNRVLWQFFCKTFQDKKRPHGNDPESEPLEDGEYFLEDTGYFNLLEYEELQDARKSSRHATRIAISAIIISIISTGISIYFSNLQLSSPVSIDVAQFEKLNEDRQSAKFNEVIDIEKKILEKLNAKEVSKKASCP